MRFTEFQQLVEDEFGATRATWVIQTQVLPGRNQTAAELLESGVDPRDVWEGLCRVFDVPEERWLGIDRPGF